MFRERRITYYGQTERANYSWLTGNFIYYLKKLKMANIRFKETVKYIKEIQTLKEDVFKKTQKR